MKHAATVGKKEERKMKKIRVTRNFLKDWVNEKFKQLEISTYICIDVDRTYFRSHDYEAGACNLHIICKHVASERTFVFLCFYSISYLQRELNDGYELWLKFDKYNILPNTTLEIRKIN